MCILLYVLVLCAICNIMCRASLHHRYSLVTLFSMLALYYPNELEHELGLSINVFIYLFLFFLIQNVYAFY